MTVDTSIDMHLLRKQIKDVYFGNLITLSLLQAVE
jgi:hypothetical protein